MTLTSALLALPLSWLLLFGEPFRYETSSQTDAEGQAYVIVHVQEDVGTIDVTVEGDDGFSISKTYKVRKGSKQKVSWTQKGSNVTYQVKIKTEDMMADFEFVVKRSVASGKQGNLELKSTREDIVDRHQVTYKTPFTLSNYELKVYNTDGQLIHERLYTEVVEAGSSVTVSWNSPDEIFMVQFRGEDDLQRFSEDKRVPWSLEIPHTEVIFDSGKHDVKPGEAPKVDEAWAVLAHELERLEKANKAVNANLTAQLYIVGYTDTVGNPADNQALSERRAKAIAQYFVDKGAWCEVFYAGMGERGLAVETGDSVDEARNRRAGYLLAVAPPTGPTLPSAGAYKRLSPGGPRMIQKLPELPPSYVEYKKKKAEERRKKFGAEGAVADAGGGSSSDSDGSSGDGGSSTGRGSSDDSSGSGASGSSSDAGGPPETDASKQAKGCSVANSDDAGAGLGFMTLLGLGLLGLRRRKSDALAGASRTP